MVVEVHGPEVAEEEIRPGFLPEGHKAFQVREAARVAAALQDIISKKPKKVIINGKQYLECEDWQTVAWLSRKCTARLVYSRYVEIGDAKGFEARSETVESDGRVIGAGEGLCLDNEETNQVEFDFAITAAKTEGQYGKPVEHWESWRQSIENGEARGNFQEHKKWTKKSVAADTKTMGAMASHEIHGADPRNFSRAAKQL